MQIIHNALKEGKQMNQRMTMDEIIRTYPDQWVGLVDVEWIDEDILKD